MTAARGIGMRVEDKVAVVEAEKALQEIVDLLDPMKPEASPTQAVLLVKALKQANKDLVERCKTLRALADQDASDKGLYAKRMGEAQQARDRANELLESTKAQLARYQEYAERVRDLDKYEVHPSWLTLTPERAREELKFMGHLVEAQGEKARESSDSHYDVIRALLNELKEEADMWAEEKKDE